jgi:hypothetical protein
VLVVLPPGFGGDAEALLLALLLDPLLVRILTGIEVLLEVEEEEGDMAGCDLLFDLLRRREFAVLWHQSR